MFDVQVRTLSAGLQQHPRGLPAYGVSEALPRASDVEPVLALLAKLPAHAPGSSAAKQQMLQLARPSPAIGASTAPSAAGATTAASAPGAPGPARVVSGAGGALSGAMSESTARASSPLLAMKNSIGALTFAVSDYDYFSNILY